MRAIILAAGRGSRMKELTEERPKCLVELHGKSLLDWQIEALRAAGIAEIAIVTGYRHELVANRGLFEFHNALWAETNMVSSLACAKDWLSTSPCVVSYSDIFYCSGIVRSLITSNETLSVAYDPDWYRLWTDRFDDPLDDAESFQKSPDGFLVDVGNRPASIEDVQGQYMGLLRFTPSSWDVFETAYENLTSEEKVTIHMTGMLQKLITGGCLNLYCIPNREEWAEVDSSRDLTVASNIVCMFLQRKNLRC